MDHVWFGLGLAALTATTLLVGRWARVELGWDPLVAIVRAAVQLGVLALLIRGILTVPWTVLAFVVLMLSTASFTSSRRLSELWHGRRTAVAGVLAGSAVSLGLVFALRLVDLEARYVIAIGGIVIGSAMTSATLAGRNFLRASKAQADVIEGWLALGATPSQAHDETGRTAVRESLLPTLDQSRSTGLVTLPGAFVVTRLAGRTPYVLGVQPG